MKNLVVGLCASLLMATAYGLNVNYITSYRQWLGEAFVGDSTLIFSASFIYGVISLVSCFILFKFTEMYSPIIIFACVSLALVLKQMFDVYNITGYYFSVIPYIVIIIFNASFSLWLIERNIQEQKK